MSDIVERLRDPVAMKRWWDQYGMDAADEIDRLRKRLEIDPRHGYDGIHCRDETIRIQEAEIGRLRTEIATLRKTDADHAD